MQRYPIRLVFTVYKTFFLEERQNFTLRVEVVANGIGRGRNETTRNDSSFKEKKRLSLKVKKKFYIFERTNVLCINIYFICICTT